MALDFLHANHLGGQAGGFEPQRVNNGELIITGLEGIGGGRDDALRLSVASFPLPKVSTGVIEVGYLNERRKFAGHTAYDDLSVTFKDHVDKDTAAILWKWRQIVHDPVTGKTGMAAAYKKLAYIRLYAPNGTIERQYRLEGCWLSAMDPGEIDYQGEDAVNIQVTLTIDKFYPEFAGIKPG